MHTHKNAAGSWSERNALPILLVFLALALCYANSLRVPFLLDDPLPGTTLHFRTRQLVWASFALNRLWSGGATWSYHLFNALLHGLCGLALLGVLRRGLALALPGWTCAARANLALAVTLLWLCHPLQTASVTYLSQRAEALATLGYLGALYGFLRALEPSPAGRGAWRWQALSLASLALGFLAKEIVATAPLVLLLAEVALVPGALRANLVRRWRFHLSMALAAAALFFVYVAPLFFLGESGSGFAADTRVGALDYARSQPGVILHYLRLVLWPHPLVFDYGWPVARALTDWLPQTLALAGLLALTLVLLVRRAPLGFVLAVFFVVLAPSSSLVPIKDLAFEHRMYLPLAPVLLLVAVLVQRACARWLPGHAHMPALAAWLAVIALAALTARRNHDYRSAVALWSSVVEHAPKHARAYNNLAAALLDEERLEEAERALARAQELAPPTSFVHRNLARLAADRGQLEPAIGHLERALALHDSGAARSDLALLLRATGRLAESEPHLRRALELEPARRADQLELGRLLETLGRAEEALAQFRRAHELDPGSQEARASVARLAASLEKPRSP